MALSPFFVIVLIEFLCYVRNYDRSRNYGREEETWIDYEKFYDLVQYPGFFQLER